MTSERPPIPLTAVNEVTLIVQPVLSMEPLTVAVGTGHLHEQA